MENGKASLLSNKVVLNLLSLVFVDKSRNDACSGDVFSLFNSSSSGYPWSSFQTWKSTSLAQRYNRKFSYNGKHETIS